MTSLLQARALYDFEPQAAGEITIWANETVTVINKVGPPLPAARRLSPLRDAIDGHAFLFFYVLQARCPRIVALKSRASHSSALVSPMKGFHSSKEDWEKPHHVFMLALRRSFASHPSKWSRIGALVVRVRVVGLGSKVGLFARVSTLVSRWCF